MDGSFFESFSFYWRTQMVMRALSNAEYSQTCITMGRLARSAFLSFETINSTPTRISGSRDGGKTSLSTVYMENLHRSAQRPAFCLFWFSRNGCRDTDTIHEFFNTLLAGDESEYPDVGEMRMLRFILASKSFSCLVDLAVGLIV